MVPLALLDPVFGEKLGHGQMVSPSQRFGIVGEPGFFTSAGVHGGPDGTASFLLVNLEEQLSVPDQGQAEPMAIQKQIRPELSLIINELSPNFWPVRVVFAEGLPYLVPVHGPPNVVLFLTHHRTRFVSCALMGCPRVRAKR